MNIPKFSLDNSRIIYFFLIIMLVGGVLSFDKLAKKEDAPFVIKQVVLMTSYPGATPQEVESLITEPIEREIQTMAGVYKIKSDSYFGLSKISVELEPSTPPEIIPQKWDELRRKTLNIQPKLPASASTISVSDDFGDVFGIYYSLTADDGYTYAEMRKWAQHIKTQLETVDGVQKVSLFGEQREVINMFINLPTLANLGINPNSIIQIVQSQNQLISTGVKQAGQMNLTINASGTYANLDDIRNQILTTKDGTQIRLSDVATVEKGYANPPSTLMKVDGKRAIGVGVSTLPDRDVVKTGDLVKLRIEETMKLIPLGLELESLYLEDEIARDANNGFIINLIESIAIVIIIILLVMGWRAGVLIGSSLLFSIGGTMLIMLMLGVGLNRTSLAGFIIAMGMLVDNAIVVVDNAQVAMKRGTKKRKSLIEGATGPQWGLFGATFIGVASFLPLYLAPSAVAEIVNPMFIVLAISLALSWVLALTQTPLFGSFMLKEPNPDTINADPYDTKFYNSFDKMLRKLIKFRWVTISAVVALFFCSIFVMGLAPQSFFPNLDKPYFRADCYLPDGYSVHDTDKQMQELSDYLTANPNVKKVSYTVGSSPLRYYLATASIGPKPNVANILIELHNQDSTVSLEHQFSAYTKEKYPDMLVRSTLFKLSPAVEATIELGFIGANPDTLIMLSNQAKELMRQCDLVEGVRSDWGNKVPILQPHYSQNKGQRLGITRGMMAQYTKLSTEGIPMGEYREGDLFMPILLKDANIDNFNLANMGSIPIFNANNLVVSLDQITDSITQSYGYSVLKRFNREKVIRTQCDPLIGANAIEAYNQVYKKVSEGMTIPEGYRMRIFGEQESQTDSNEALAENMPLTLILIMITLLLLFRSYRRPVVILLMLPLILIGVVAGLAITGKMFDFFSILGLLGLVGMNIKNAVVLVEQIDIESAMGLSPLNAIIAATKSRIVPVVMASGTTILGMLPLLPDALFGGMAATIMGGLFVATFLTIVILPVTYTIVLKIKSK